MIADAYGHLLVLCRLVGLLTDHRPSLRQLAGWTNLERLAIPAEFGPVYLVLMLNCWQSTMTLD